MKRILEKLTEVLADAALLEMGVQGKTAVRRLPSPEHETLEENLIEVAFAEAADYDQIHTAIMREHFKADDQIHADECQYGDNDVCFVH
jgi:hypothetical protein